MGDRPVPVPAVITDGGVEAVEVVEVVDKDDAGDGGVAGPGESERVGACGVGGSATTAGGCRPGLGTRAKISTQSEARITLRLPPRPALAFTLAFPLAFSLAPAFAVCPAYPFPSLPSAQ